MASRSLAVDDPLDRGGEEAEVVPLVEGTPICRQLVRDGDAEEGVLCGAAQCAVMALEGAGEPPAATGLGRGTHELLTAPAHVGAPQLAAAAVIQWLAERIALHTLSRIALLVAAKVGGAVAAADLAPGTLTTGEGAAAPIAESAALRSFCLTGRRHTWPVTASVHTGPGTHRVREVILAASVDTPPWAVVAAERHTIVEALVGWRRHTAPALSVSTRISKITRRAPRDSEKHESSHLPAAVNHGSIARSPPTSRADDSRALDRSCG
jgi:hypothetical protein